MNIDSFSSFKKMLREKTEEHFVEQLEPFGVKCFIQGMMASSKGMNEDEVQERVREMMSTLQKDNKRK